MYPAKLEASSPIKNIGRHHQGSQVEGVAEVFS
jgi:hypothetical protein